jgi:hypothetical protein
MKKLKLLFVVTLALTIASCSNNDDDSSNTSGDILGTWVGVDVDYSGNSVTEFAGEEIVSDFVGEAFDVDYTLVFTENPNELVTDGSYSIELTTTTAGQTQVETVENLEFLNDGTWSKSGNELTITSNGQTTVATILELTDNSLTLKSVTEQGFSQQGITIITTVNAIATYIRQ